MGIATFDDIIELFVVFAVVTIIPTLGSVNISADLFDVVRLGIFGGIVALLLVILKKFRATTSAHEPHRTSILALIFGVFFVFISFGLHSSLDIAVIGAIAAGVLVRAVLPAARTPIIGQHVQAITYSFFAPIFFFDVGFETNSKYLLSHIFLVLLFIIAAKIAKVAASYFVGSKVLGTKKSIFMGVALGVRFSTSIVILKLLHDANLVPIELYSLLIGTSVIFKFFVPLLLSFLAKRWKPAIAS